MKAYLFRGLVLFFFVVATGMLIKDKSLFKIEDVKISVNVKGSDKLAWADINHSIGVLLNKYKGQSLWSVSLRQVRSELLQYKEVQGLQVIKSWPQTLEVQYTLPELKAIYQREDGAFEILAADGEWVGPVKWSKLPSLPWIKGQWIQKQQRGVEGTLKLLERLPASGPLSIDQVSEIQFNDLDGFLVTLIKTGQQIRFGSENFEVKALRVGQVLEYLQTRGLESRVIDANFSKKVLVRLRNHP